MPIACFFTNNCTDNVYCAYALATNFWSSNVQSPVHRIERLILFCLLPQDIPSPRIMKTHMMHDQMAGGPPTDSPAKYIYIARNPKDVVVSMYHHSSARKYYEFTGTLDDFFKLFVAGKVQWGSWFEHVLDWWSHKGAEEHTPILLITPCVIVS